MKLLLCCLLGGTISSCVSFIIPITTSLTSGGVIKYHGVSTKSTTKLSSTSNDNSSTNKSNLKSLLPKQKRHTIPLDKYGRRIHDLKSDGMPKYSVSGSSSSSGEKEANIGISTYGEKEDMAAPMLSDHDITKQQQQQRKVSSPSLSQYFNKDSSKQQQGSINSDAVLGKENTSADLKALLPKQKMKFMKLDKFGRRIQRMEDDGTVNYSKEPTSGSSSSSSTAPPPPQSSSPSSPIRGTREGFNSDSSKPTDESPAATSSSDSGGNYGSLKELTTSIQRPTWTKLDFKGGSVEDTSRTKGMKSKGVGGSALTDDPGGSIGGGGGNLQDLLPKRATWTKLDFKGVPVEDLRRTKRNTTQQQGNTDSFNKGEYTSLKTLLPERTIKWRKKEQLLSSGAATSGEVKRELRRREERQKAMKDEVLASAEQSSSSDAVASSDEDITGDSDDDEEEVKPYQNLKDLLPERKMGAQKRIKQ